MFVTKVCSIQTNAGRSRKLGEMAMVISIAESHTPPDEYPLAYRVVTTDGQGEHICEYRVLPDSNFAECLMCQVQPNQELVTIQGEEDIQEFLLNLAPSSGSKEWLDGRFAAIADAYVIWNDTLWVKTQDPYYVLTTLNGHLNGCRVRRGDIPNDEHLYYRADERELMVHDARDLYPHEPMSDEKVCWMLAQCRIEIGDEFHTTRPTHEEFCQSLIYENVKKRLANMWGAEIYEFNTKESKALEALAEELTVCLWKDKSIAQDFYTLRSGLFQKALNQTLLLPWHNNR